MEFEFEVIKHIVEFGIVGACFAVFLLLYIKGTQRHLDDMKKAGENERDAYKVVLPVAEEASSTMRGLAAHLESAKERELKLMAMMKDVKDGQAREEQTRTQDRSWYEAARKEDREWFERQLAKILRTEGR